MSKRDTLLLIEDMLTAAEKINIYTAGLTFETFIADDKTVDAVVRNFEIIGEAANRIEADFKTDHPEIEWRRIVGFRNRIVHDYFGIDFEILWSIKEENIAELVTSLKSISGNL